MKACGRSALCWPKPRPRARRLLATRHNRNGRTDKSYGLDLQFTKLKKDLSLALREISNLKNQLHQAKENIAKEHAGRGSKSKKYDSPDL